MTRVVAWGTFDVGKPRVRILLRGLREAGVDVQEIHHDVWRGVEDKSSLSRRRARLRRALRWLAGYPWLIVRYLRAPRHDAVVVGYLGQLDVLVLWPFARLRGVPIVWDAFMSLYDTLVLDRALVPPDGVRARLVRALERLACRAADRVVLDTRAHAQFFVEHLGLDAARADVVWVGAEPEAFPADRAAASQESDGRKVVLFYGQFIPLHGIETIVQAARLAECLPIRWIVIGSGQEAPRIANMVAEAPLASVEWVRWVPYRELADWIARADVGLGIFGCTDKASRVVPNKVYQLLLSGAPVVTRDSAAMRELIGSGRPGVRLVPPGDAVALLAAVQELLREGRAQDLHADLRDQLTPRAVGETFAGVVRSAIGQASARHLPPADPGGPA